MPFSIRLSKDGLLTVPAALRKKYRWIAGQMFEVQEVPDGLSLKAAPYIPSTSLPTAAGMLHRPGERARTIAEMNEGIEAEVLARHARGRY